MKTHDEQVAGDKRKTCFPCFAKDWLAGKATPKFQRLSSTAAASDFSYGYAWAFHESEEIGPVMLAKIAKKTGLKPEDL